MVILYIADTVLRHRSPHSTQKPEPELNGQLPRVTIAAAGEQRLLPSHLYELLSVRCNNSH